MHLFDFPREIRDLITISALTSDTGLLRLFHNAETPPPQSLPCVASTSSYYPIGTISYLQLSLLSTCRQLNRECKIHLFKHNTFFFWPQFMPSHISSIQWHIQHVKLRYDLLSDDILEELALSRLGLLRILGELKSLTLMIVDPDNLELFCRFEAPKVRIRHHIHLLAEAGKHGALENMKRRIEVNMKKEEGVARDRRRFWGFERVLLHANEAFGGELWLNDKLKFVEKIVDHSIRHDDR